MKSKIFFSLLAFLLLTQVIAVVQAADSTAIEFTLTDQRPSADVAKKDKLLSRLASSCDYSIFQLSDNKQPVDRIARLKTDLLTGLGEKLKGKTIVVTQYDAYFNGRTFFSNRAFGFGGGSATATAIQGMSDNCPREKVTGGWYGAADVTTPHSPYIVEISVQMDGKDYPVRSVFSPSIQLYTRSPGAKEAEAFVAAQTKANSELAKNLVAALN